MRSLRRLYLFVDIPTIAEEEEERLLHIFFIYSDCWTCSKLFFQVFALPTIVKKILYRGLMSYQIIPLPSDIPSQSQQDILDNFNQINIQFGTEHSALNGAADGKHKYVTFVQTPGAPAVAGDDWQMTHELVANTDFLRVQDSTPIDQYVPVRRQLSTIPIIIGTTKIIDLSLLGDQHVGNILVIDHNQRDRTIFSPYCYVSPQVSVPGSAGQLIASNVAFTKLNKSTTWITIESNIVTTVDVILTYSFY